MKGDETSDSFRRKLLQKLELSAAEKSKVGYLFLSPRGVGNVLEWMLHLAYPIRPPGDREGNRLGLVPTSLLPAAK